MNVFSSSIERQLFSSRRLLQTFVMRDLRARYAGSALGIFWSVINPLIILLMYIVVFSTLVKGANLRVGGRTAGYAVYLCPALLAWNWLFESLVGACNSVTGNATLIKKVVFPAAILPIAPILLGLIPFAVAMLIFLIFAWGMGVFAPVSVIYLCGVALLQFLLLLGPAYLLASLNVFVRDTSQIVMAGLQLLFWATPVVYTQEALGKQFPWMLVWFEINPAAHLVEAYRDAIIVHRPPALSSVVYVISLSIIAYHAGRAVFLRGRRHFPDEV